jgi:peroxiredoxin
MMQSTAAQEAPRVGQEAPEFRLPTAQGGELGPQDFRGKRRVVLWFSKGLFCPFCRRNMAQLGMRYDEIRALDAEILQVTHNTADEARIYFKSYPIKFPYLCDPERVAHDRYGVPLVGKNVGGMLASTGLAAADFVLRGERTALPMPFLKRYSGNDSAQAVFILDREGIVRVERRLGPNAPLPAPADLLRELAALG